MPRMGTAQRKDFEGHVNERGHIGKAKVAGSGMNPHQIGGVERNSGKTPMSKGAYSNEIDEPAFQKINHKAVGPDEQLGMMVDCSDFKREASGQAYGQAGIQGCGMDDRKIRDQFRPVYSDDTGY